MNTMSITEVDATFGFNPELGEILLSYTSVNMIFAWVTRNLNVKTYIYELLNDNDMAFSVLFDDIEKQKIMVIIKLLISNIGKRFDNLKFPSKDATIMANAVGLVLMTAKGLLNDIKEDFYGYMEFLDKKVASGEITEHQYKSRLDNCKFIGGFLDKIELFDWDNGITGRWFNSKKDGEQCLIINYKNICHCCRCCRCCCWE
jgi:hypothetical protein